MALPQRADTRFISRSLALLCLLVVFGLLGGCSGWTGAALEGFSVAWRGGVDLEAAKLDPGLRYLEVDANGVKALLVLGNTDPDPAGPIEVWYSADRAVLRLQGGRLVGISGAGQDWIDVVLHAAPPLAAANAAYDYRRTRTEMPGHRYRSETVHGALLAATPGGIPERWQKAGLAWIGEDVATGGKRLPAVYGLQAGQLVYGRQCLAETRCVSWQPLPAGAGKPLD